jgi:hypothetical protein
MGKKCPYCGRPLHNAAFKCTSCNKWVDNEVFRRLCEDDVKFIKDKDLTPFTPTLLAMMVIDLLKKEGQKESAQKLEKLQGRALNEIQRFNLLVFESYCFFKAICSSVKIKQGRRDAIEGMLKLILLKWSAQLFNSRVKHAPSWEVLMERGEVLYAKFEAAWLKIPWEADPASQMEASDAFASAIYADDDSNLLRGFNLWNYFMGMLRFGRMGFSKMFLVEEEDFNWQAIGGI